MRVRHVEKRKLIISLICAFMSTVSLFLSLRIVTGRAIVLDSGVEQPGRLFKMLWDLKMSLPGTRISMFITFAALTFLFYYVMLRHSKVPASVIVVACLFAFFEVFGTSFRTTDSWDLVFFSKRTFVKACISFTGYAVLFVFLLLFLSDLFSRIRWRKAETPWSFFTCNKRSLFIVAGIILLMWLPYYIAAFPGLTNYDFFDMLNTYYGIDTNSLRVVVPIDPSVTLNNNNPVLQVLYAVFIMKIGSALGSPYIGLGLFVVIQAVLFALVLSYALYWLARRGVRRAVRIAVLLFYGLVPVHANYAITTLKDTNFSFVTLLYLLLIIELVTERERFLSSRKKLAALTLTAVLMVFLRNNGVYVVGLSAVVFLLLNIRHWKKLALPLFLPVLLFALATHVVYPAFKISPGSPAEAYSVPLQQVARLVCEHEDEISKEDRTVIRTIMWYDMIKPSYDPELSDGVKKWFYKDSTDEQRKAFFKVWFKYLKRFPGTYIQATMNNCYGYFYPEASSWLTYRQIAETGEPYGLFNDEDRQTIREESTLMANVFRKIPVLGLLESIGFHVWTLLFLMVCLLRHRRGRIIAMFTPMLVLVLTVIAGPANTMFRYVYPLVVAMPIYVIVTGVVIHLREGGSS